MTHEQQTRFANFVGQAQISDAEQLGGPGRFSFSVSILQPDQLQGAGFLIGAEGQGQRKGPGLVLLTLGGKELLVLSGGVRKMGMIPFQGDWLKTPPVLPWTKGISSWAPAWS